MKCSLLLLFASMISHAYFSQTNSELTIWMAEHPDVYLVSSDTYQTMSEARKEQLSDNIIIFNGELSMDQLKGYSSPSEKSISASKISPLKESEANQIKQWLSQHQDIKVVPRSMYDSFDSDKQQFYVSNGALILNGEDITVEDIRNY